MSLCVSVKESGEEYVAPRRGDGEEVGEEYAAPEEEFGTRCLELKDAF